MSVQAKRGRTASETIEKLRRALESAQVLVWTADTNYRITSLSPSVSASLNPAEYVDLTAWLSLIHPEDVERVREAFNRAITTKAEYHLEYRVVLSNGNVRWMLGTAAPQFTQSGQWAGYHGSVVDVTQRHDALQELARSEATHRLLMENSWDIISHHDSRGTVLYASPSCERILGYMPAELLGTNAYHYLHPDDVPAILEQLNAQKGSTSDAVLLEFRHRHKQGHYVWMSAQAKVLHDPGTGERIGTISVARDITYQRQAEQELRTREERFRSLTNLSSDWYWETDAQGRFTFMSDGLERLFGCTRNEVIGRTRVERAADTQQPGLLEYLAKVNNQEPFRNIHYSVYVPEKDAIRHSAISGEPLFVNGEFKGYRGIGRDITEEIEISQRIAYLADENKALIDNSLDMIALVDDAGKLLRVNHAVESILGYSSEEVVGRSYSEFLNPVELPLVRSIEDELRSGRTEVKDFETSWIRKDGVYVQLALNIRWSHVQRKMYVTARDITERKQTEERLEQLATHDTLTDLPNRVLLKHRLDAMLTSTAAQQQIAVMFIDLDQFKAVNDSLGHGPGDVLLREVASQLKAHIRPHDFVARLGGDEFVVVASCSDGQQSASVIAERLLDKLAEPLRIDGHEVVVGASIGISMFPADGRTHDALMQSADIAMYRAKAAGRNCYRFFASSMAQEAKRRLYLESALRHAVERNEFELYYQPRVNLKDLSVVGMEALLRWNHPELGRVSPMDFIPLAEERGLIKPIGKWVLEQACIQARRLMDKYERPFRMSVNLSARQLKGNDLAKHVAYCLFKANLPPQLLELELTESALIDDIERSAAVLAELKNLGISLAVDDFGTGYSSLAYLQRFPLDVLKLDRAFVSEAENVQFIQAFLGLAHALKMSVVAEGIETTDTLHFLRKSACDEGQGFLFAKPLPVNELEAFLEATEHGGRWKCKSSTDCFGGCLSMPEADRKVVQIACLEKIV